MENIKEVKAILGQYKKYKGVADVISHQIDDITDRSICIKSTSNLSGMPHGGAAYTYADVIADKDDLERRRKKYLTIATQEREIVQAYIDTVVSVKHHRFLMLYYVNCISVSDIAKLEGYTGRHAFRMFHEALAMVDLSINLV